MTLSQHRARARQYLGGNIFSSRWMYSLLACVIISIVSSLASSIAIGSLLLGGALLLGSASFFIALARNGEEKPQLERLIDGFSNGFVENLLLFLMMTIFTALWSLLFIIPGIVKSYAYSMAFNVRKDHPEYTWKQCLDESIRITNGHKMRLFLLDLSFIGWFIVGSLACGIGILWVVPYIEAAHVSYYESIREGVVEATAEPIA